MKEEEYHNRIIDYYRDTRHAYKDSWDLDNSLAIHYGYTDDGVKNFPQSLIRMNEVMMEMAAIKAGNKVLDAGCGVGGSSIFLAAYCRCHVTGISLSSDQIQQAVLNAQNRKVDNLTDFRVMDYSNTSFPSATFDIVWGCESICYAVDKKKFIQEAFRLLKPGGRLVIADGFVSSFENNANPVIRQWLDGWQVNYLETAARMQQYMKLSGFVETSYRNITDHVRPSSKRLHRFYFLASLYLLGKKLSLAKPPTAMQIGNIRACRFQHLGLKKKLWEYAIVLGKKAG